MAFERKKVGEDWTDSDKDLKTTGTLESGAQTVTGAIDASGEITGATIVQGSDPVLDESDLIAGGGTIIVEGDIVNTGNSVPSSTFAGKFWFDTSNNLLKMRNEADDGWLDIWDTANDKPIIDNFVDEITGVMLAPAVAGDGLVQDGSGNLDVNVDDSTIELSGDALRVKNAGITVGKLATGNAQVSVSSNDSTPGRLNGKLVAGENIVLTETNDGADEILTISADDRILHSDFSNNDVTGTTLETDLIAFTIPADTVSAGNIIRIKAFIEAFTLVGNATIKFYLDGVWDSDFSYNLSDSADELFFEVDICIVSTSSQRRIGKVIGLDSTVEIAERIKFKSYSADMTSSIIVKFTCELSNSGDTIRSRTFSVELIK